MCRFIYLSNKKLKDVNPVECGEEDCPKDFSRGPIVKNHYLLHYVFSGSGTYNAGGKSYTVDKGQMFIIRPDETVEYYADPENPWHYCWVGFELSIDVPALEENYVLSVPQADYIFRTLKDSYMIENEREYYICGKIFELLSMLAGKAQAGSQAEEYALRAKNYIDVNFTNQISVESLAEDLNLNRSYLSTIFKKYVGKPPMQYLVDVRLKHAASLMLNHGYSVSSAASGSGYPDIYNFSKIFKQKYGMSPASYVKQFKLKDSGNNK